MSHTPEEFCADCHEIPKTGPMADGRERIRRKCEEHAGKRPPVEQRSHHPVPYQTLLN